MRVKLKVIAPNGTGRRAKVFLDDKPLMGVCRVEVDVDVDVQCPNFARISFYPMEVELDVELADVNKDLEVSVEEERIRGGLTCEPRW